MVAVRFYSLAKGPLTQSGSWLMIIVGFVIALPLVIIVYHLFMPNFALWHHLLSTVLPDYFINSILLISGVALGTGILGVVSAWLVTYADFWGKAFFSWALLCPIALPVYIMAYVYVDILNSSGPIQGWIRAFGQVTYGNYWFPNINSLPGACVIFSLALYPYVYILCKNTFSKLSRELFEVSRALSHNALSIFLKLMLPLARPAMIGGIALALMETLADYGAVEYLGIPTFTTGIFRTWFGLDEPSSAAGLSACLLLFVSALIWIEKKSRHQARYYQSGSSDAQTALIQLSSGQRWLAFVFCAGLLSVAFIIPVSYLLYWSLKTMDVHLEANFLELLLNSITLAAGSSVGIVGIGLFLCLGLRFYPSRLNHIMINLINVGYAIPGAVIAIGLMMLVIHAQTLLGADAGRWFVLLTSSSVTLVLYAYFSRFTAIAVQSLGTGLTQIEPAMEESARSLGLRFYQILWRLHLPLLSKSVLFALLLVFVEVIKELPATLILRPFNFNTLAVRAYQFASDERFIDAALPALCIVMIGILPVLLIHKTSMQGKQ